MPPRVGEPWEPECQGLYASPHVVAQMKKTCHARDWDAATALGVKLLEAGDPRGWLHIYDAALLRGYRDQLPCPDEIRQRRPSLELLDDAGRLRSALAAEQLFWQELDHARTAVFEGALPPYLAALRRAEGPPGDLMTQHRLRLACAHEHLERSPLLTYGVERLIQEVRDAVGQVLRPEWLRWLPDVRARFAGLK